MTKIAPYFLGCRRTLTPEWQNIVPELKVASNLKDPVKIAEAQEKAMKTLSRMPLTGRIVEASIFNGKGEEIFYVGGSGVQVASSYFTPTPDLVAMPGAAVLCMLATLFPDGFDRLPPSYELPPDQPVLMGFDVHDNIRIGALEAAMFPNLPVKVTAKHWKTSQFSDKPSVIDPYHYLLTADQRAQIKLPVLLEKLRCPAVDPEKNPDELAKSLAFSAYALAKETSLF